jgi:glutathione S-transferase
LSHDDPLQPLYRGPPLPLCVLESAGITADSNGSYEASALANTEGMQRICRLMAAWKLAGNGDKVSKFAARGGLEGSQNPRKQFGAELADPYALSDTSVQSTVDAALRVVCLALSDANEEGKLSDSYRQLLLDVVPSNQVAGVVGSIAYLRDRIGVPRDLPLASGRYLRAYLNWGIDVLSKNI